MRQCSLKPPTSLWEATVASYAELPQDRAFAEQLVSYKAEAAASLEELNQLEFAGSFMKKLGAMESGDKSKANEGSKDMLRLCNEQFPVALVSAS